MGDLSCVVHEKKERKQTRSFVNGKYRDFLSTKKEMMRNVIGAQTTHKLKIVILIHY